MDDDNIRQEPEGAAYDTAHTLVWELIDTLVDKYGISTRDAAQAVLENAQSCLEATQ